MTVWVMVSVSRMYITVPSQACRWCVKRCVKDVLRYKIRAGLMDKNPYLYSTEDVKLDTKEERQTAYDIATAGVLVFKF